MSDIRWCKVCEDSIPHDIFGQQKIGGRWRDGVGLAILNAFTLGWTETRAVARCQKCDTETILD